MPIDPHTSIVPKVFRVKMPRRLEDEWLPRKQIRIVQGETIVVEVDCSAMIDPHWLDDQGDPDDTNAPTGVSSTKLGADRATARVQVVAASDAAGSGQVSFTISSPYSGPMFAGFRIEVLS